MARWTSVRGFVILTWDMKANIRGWHAVHAIKAEASDPALREERLARLEEMENQLFERAAALMEAGLSFYEIKQDQEEPPADWVAQYGRVGAEQRLAIAKSQWLPASQSPGGMQLASRFLTGSMRARGTRVKATQNNLNVVISLPAPATAEHPAQGQQFPVKEIDT